jgi:penicillin-binding protein 1A
MQKALEGKPVRSFTVPEGIVFARIDAKTGLLPNKNSQETIFECFKEGTVPTASSPEPDTAIDPDELYKEGI